MRIIQTYNRIWKLEMKGVNYLFGSAGTRKELEKLECQVVLYVELQLGSHSGRNREVGHEQRGDGCVLHCGLVLYIGKKTISNCSIGAMEHKETWRTA